MRNAGPLVITIPGGAPILVAHVMLDFTGTLSCDGVLLPGVADRIRRLARHAPIVVATADTFGTVREALNELPVEIRLVKTGEDKVKVIRALDPFRGVAIGNGRNDVGMVREAAIGIAVVGPEGAAGELLAVADVVVRDVCEAFDLLLNPLRLVATLRP